jgi:hypothetical protein
MKQDPTERAAEVAFGRLRRAGGNPRRLAEPARTLVLVYGAQGVIDNGGFRYFFENDWPGRPPYSWFSRAYRRIGANRAAALLDEAVTLFPFARPHLARRKRNVFIDTLAEDSRLFALGDRLCGDTSVWRKLEKFVVANRGQFAAAQR